MPKRNFSQKKHCFKSSKICTSGIYKKTKSLDDRYTFHFQGVRGSGIPQIYFFNDQASFQSALMQIKFFNVTIVVTTISKIDIKEICG